MINDIKVILIGGSPMVGKTTLANQLCSRYGYSCLSTDDIGEILQTVTDINPMKGLDYRQYYIDKSEEELIEDIQEYHIKIWPAVKRLVEIHSSWGTPIVIEGYALYPQLVNSIKTKGVRSIWLIGDEELFQERIAANKLFHEGASVPKLMIKKYLQRSIWHNLRLLQEATECGEVFFNVNELLSQQSFLDEVTNVLTEG